ncbi:MAG: hypothetical protein DPW09_18480 [Anaerolineae bacterium]|nr:PD40 domain-containing protein [Anaerolineales bacterium]MCQ3975432.1 hypothetical protein [Anaerolineae bacterium]
MEFSETNRTEDKISCPFLGLCDDRDSRFSYPETAHCCFAVEPVAVIELQHQAAFCFSQEYRACPRFVELAPQPPSRPETKKQGVGVTPLWQTILWSLAGLLISLLVIFSIFYFSGWGSVPPLVTQVASSPTATQVATPTPPKPTNEEPTPIPGSAVAVIPTLTATPTPAANGSTYTLSPSQSDAGWLASNEAKGNHFGDSFLYAGIFKGQIYISAFQFDLRNIPRGAPIFSASLQLTGLRDERLGIHIDQPSEGVAWAVRLLDPAIDEAWRPHNFQEIFNASVLQTLTPILSVKDLAVGRTNTFELSPAQLKILETRIVEDEKPRVSFRIDGPVVGSDNLFAWDTGYGGESLGNGVTLVLKVGPEPATPPPFDYVIVTSTPTPENVVTAAAVVLKMTADATRIGTATPAPANMVTATPIPDYLVIVPTPSPENVATARAMAEIATAEALTTGTPTPIPTNAVTATPTATPIPTSLFGSADTSGPVSYVLITSTPTPETIFAAATQSAIATAQAQSGIIPTPLPANWVTPVVVTFTPTPANEATAQAMSALATAIAFTTGTPTPTPPNVVTATPTPAYDIIPLLLTPPATQIPPPVLPIPSALLGKILFKSDREVYGAGLSLTGEEYEQLTGETAPPPGAIVTAPDPDTREIRQYIIRPPADVYVFDPETGELGRLSRTWPYDLARARDTYSPDTVYQVYTKQLLWTNVQDSETGLRTPTEVLALHIYDYKFKVEKILTEMGAGIVYDPAWSPTSDKIAFTATESGNDEIWVINTDGTQVQQLTRNTWEWDKSPSWSPDGKQIVFMSNRTGNQQLWIMNADGSDPKLLFGWDNWTPYNDWGPVWVKYLDPPPPPDQER